MQIEGLVLGVSQESAEMLSSLSPILLRAWSELLGHFRQTLSHLTLTCPKLGMSLA